MSLSNGRGFFYKGEKMKYCVLIGVDQISGEFEALATGNFTEMNKAAKKMVSENPTKWPKVKIIYGERQTFRCAEPKPKAKRGRKTKEEE